LQALKAVSVGSERIGENEGITPVVLGATHRMAVPESVDLLGIDGEHGDAALEKSLDHGAMRFFDCHRDAFGIFARETQEPGERSPEPVGAMLESSLLKKLPVGIDHAGLVKPLAKVDTDVQLVVESIHGSLLAQRV
jgi:hypothetical protein